MSAVLSYTLRHLRLEAQEHVTAKDVCAGFAEYTRLYFNDSAEALDLLSEWGLRCSEDVGRIIWAMVKAGLATSAEGDSPEDFAGVFTLDDIASASFWKPKANRNGGNEQRGSSR